MGRKMRIELPDEAPAPPDLPEVEAAREMVREIEIDAPGMEARVWRTHPAFGQREVYTGLIDPTLLAQNGLAALADAFGGGRFRVKVIGPMPSKNGGRGRGQLKELYFDVDPTIPPRHPAGMRGPGDTAPAPRETPDAPVSSGGAADRINSLMEMGFMRLMEQMAGRQPQPAPQTDWTPVVVAGLQALPAVIGMFRNGDGASSLTMMTELLKEALVRRPDPVAAPDAVEQLEKTMRLLRSVQGGGDAAPGAEPHDWKDVLVSYAPVVNKMLGAAAESQQTGQVAPVIPFDSPEGQAIRARAIEHGKTITVAPTETEPQAEPTEMHSLLVQQMAEQVRDMYRQGRDPELCADYIVDGVPDATWAVIEGVLREHFRTPNGLLVRLQSAIPEARADWLHAFANQVFYHLESPDDAPKPGAGNSGDTPNA